MAKAKFNKNETVLHVANVGGASSPVWKIKEVEIFSCGMKQIILKEYSSDGTPWKGAKYKDCFEQFFKLEDKELADVFRLKREEHSRKVN